MSKNQRHQLRPSDLEAAIAELHREVKLQATQKGMGVFTSSHEIHGVLHQELSEYEDAIHQRLGDEQKVRELLDVAATALWGVASIRAKATDW